MAGTSSRVSMALAVLLPGLAFAVETTFWHWFDPFAWLLFYPAVLACCWWGGLWPGIVATALSSALGSYFLVPPRYALEVSEGPASISVVVFFFMGVFFAWMCERLRQTGKDAARALEVSRRLNELLDERVAERTAELEQSHANAREGEALLRNIVDTAMDALVGIDAEGRIALLNASAEATLRCSASEAVGTHVERFVPAGLRARYTRLLGAFLRRPTLERQRRPLLRLRGERADGEEFALEASLVCTSAAQRRLTIVMFRDLSERQREQAALRMSEERFHSMFDNMLEGCQFLDREFRYLYLNDSVLAHARVPRDALLGRRMTDPCSRPSSAS